MIVAHTPFHNTSKKSKALSIKKKLTNFPVIHNYTIHNLHFAYLLSHLLYIRVTYTHIYSFRLKKKRIETAFQRTGQIQPKWNSTKGERISSFSKIRECTTAVVSHLPFVNGQELLSGINVLQICRQTFGLMWHIQTSQNKFPWLSSICTEAQCTKQPATTADRTLHILSFILFLIYLSSWQCEKLNI